MKQISPSSPQAGLFGAGHFREFKSDPLGFLRRLAAEHGDFVGFLLGTRKYYLVSRPDLVRALLIEEVSRLRKPGFVADSNRGHFGDGLTTLEEPEWQRRRTLIRRAFHVDDSAAFRPGSITRACTLDWLATLPREHPFDLRVAFRTLVARIAARTLFDAELEGYGRPDENRQRTGIIPLAEAYGEDHTAVMTDEPVAPLSMTRPRASSAMPATLGIIDSRIKTREARGDVLSILIEANLERAEIVGEIMQMFFAGHLTTPSVLISLFHLLAEHPEVVARLRQEPSDGSLIECALKETMRIHPPAPILYREVAEPLSLGGFVLEPRDGVWICPHLLHHDPRYFEAPERFLPERFASGSERIPEYAYLPFGAGPRTCAGRRMAMQQMTTMASLAVAWCDLVPMGDRAPAAFVARDVPRPTD